MLRSILAIVAGLGVAVVTFSLVQGISGVLFSPPSAVDYNDKTAVAALMASMPVSAFLILAAGYMLGSFLAGWLAWKLLQSQSLAAWSFVSIIDLIFVGMVLVRVLVALSLFEGLPGAVKLLLPLVIIGAAVIGGVFLGRVTAHIQPRPVGITPGIIIGVLLTGAWIMNVVNIPHPTWVVALGFLCFIPPVLLGSWLASRTGTGRETAS